MMHIIRASLFHLIVFIFLKIVCGCDDCNKLYEPPSNIKFPYGDENQLNTDLSGPDTNMILCTDESPFMPKQGKCPFPPDNISDMQFTNPYVSCPVFPELFPPGENIPLGDPIPPSIVQCKTCDMKLTRDESAVLLKCTSCYDTPSTERKASLTEREILYKVYFIEIANYTSVAVRGRENF